MARVILETVRNFNPSHIAEALTVRQFVILWIHTYGTLVRTGIIEFKISLECVEVALFLSHLKRNYAEHVVFTILVGAYIYKFETNGIIEALLVYYVAHGVRSTGLCASGRNRPL